MLSFDYDDPSWLFNIGVILFVTLCLLVGCSLLISRHRQNAGGFNHQMNTE